MSVYYSPEEHGLTLFAELELSEPDYSFDILAVWKDQDGRLYWMSDSGCSCPSPFEDYCSVDDLLMLATELDYRYMEQTVDTADDRDAARSFLRKIRRAMKDLPA